MHCHLDVNVCTNCSFLHLYLQFYYSLDDISYFGLYTLTCFQFVFIGSVIWFIFDIYVSLRKLFSQ